VSPMTFEDRVQAARDVLAGPVPELPGWLADQVDAAERDAWRRLLAPSAAARSWSGLIVREGGTPAGREIAATLLAAVVDCRPCAHLRRARGPVPAFVALALHRALCERCVRTVVHPPADEADRCDVCGSRGNTLFRPFTIAVAHVVYLGDAAPCCESRLGLS
jgi:hypothetical protein